MADHPNDSTVRESVSAFGAAIGFFAVVSAVLILAAFEIVIDDSIVDNGGRALWQDRVPAFLYSVPYVFLVVQVFIGAPHTTCVMAQTQATLALIVGVPASLLTVLGAALSMGDADDVNAMLAVVAFTTLQIAMIVVARRLKKALPTAGPSDPRSAWPLFGPLGWALVAVAGASMASGARARATANAFGDAQRAREGVMRATACVIEWRQRTGRYPTRLGELTSEDCIDGELIAGEYAGHAVSYRLDDASGFVLLAVPHTPFARGTESPLGDGSGRVYTVREGLGYDGSPYLDALYGSTDGGRLRGLADCLVQEVEKAGDGDFPARLDQLRSCSAVRVDGAADSIELEHYTFRYRPRVDTAGRRTGFDLEARPKRYGVGAIRSYHTDETRIMRGTGANRAVTRDDPEAFECERNWGHLGTCDSDFVAQGTSLRALLGRED